MAIAGQTNIAPKSVRTVLNQWYQMLQEDISDEDCMVGGRDENGDRIIVEIDESKFGKRKYNRGSRVEGVWVVGGVERTSKRKCFLITVPNRNAETLKDIICRYVKRGSIVYTDCWRAYNGIVDWDRDYVNGTVNHSVGFVDGDVCTNTIEGIKLLNHYLKIVLINPLYRYMEWY